MCGIVGIAHLDGSPVDETKLGLMGAALRHRGPDASGSWCEGGIGLGHRRLSIIDLSPEANQPLSDVSGHNVIVFNGEIYNFPEQRRRLESDGYPFATHSDTEVILALYRERGVDCLSELRGMFAFAIYDRERRQLFLARDRVGKKPLYYAFDGSTLVFASEVKAIFAGGLLAPEPDFEQLEAFLQLGYVPGPRSAFVGVRSLPPGCYLTLSADGELGEHRYWRLNYRSKDRRSEAEWKERIAATLDEAVRIRLVSDVPLGAFLSGGMDSSAVVALMSRAQSRVKTFSIGFGDDDYDERRYARMVAERFDTEHHEFQVEPQLDEMLPVLVEHYDEPFGDPSALPSLYISRLARQQGGVTVVLNGDGGDENFGGYERYRAHRIAMLVTKVPGLRQLAPLGRYLPETRRGTTLRKGKRFLQILARARGEAGLAIYERLIGKFELDELTALLGPAWPRTSPNRHDLALATAFRGARGLRGVDELLHVDFHSYLPDDLLVKMDRASMAFSLEARSPFLDHVLLEETARMPASLKLRGFRLKYLLRELLRDLLPEEVLERPKMGFGVPLEHWFRGPMADWLRETLLDGELVRQRLLQDEAISGLIDRHVRGIENRADHLWLLIVLEFWWRRFFAD